MASTVYQPFDVTEGLSFPFGAYTTKEKALDVAENLVRLRFSEEGITEFQVFRGEQFVDGWSEKREYNFWIKKYTIR